MLIPIENINEILCFAIDKENYLDLLVLSKDIYVYLKKYAKNLLYIHLGRQYTINPPPAIDIEYNYTTKQLGKYDWEIMKAFKRVVFQTKHDYIDPIPHEDFDLALLCAFDIWQTHNRPLQILSFTTWFPHECYHSSYEHDDDLSDHENDLKILNAVNKYGGNYTSLDDIPTEYYLKIRDIIVEDFQQKYGHISMYVYQYDDFYGSKYDDRPNSIIHLRYGSMKNLPYLANVLHHKLIELENREDHVFYEGIQYVGHITIHNKEYPVYEAHDMCY